MINQFIERSGVERRQAEGQVSFPMQASTGDVILRDRRVNPDRRQAVTTQEIELSPDDFNKLFKAFEEH